MIDDWKKVIFLTVTGSTAYGTNLPDSDEDLKGIFLRPKNERDSILSYPDNYESPDFSLYDIKKFFLLASKSNPNIIELLWIPERFNIISSKEYQIIREHRDLFLSKEAKDSFLGYARSQIKRIQTHRKWILDPVVEKPERKDFGLPSQTKISESLINDFLKDRVAINTTVHQIDTYNDDLLSKEKAYLSALKHYNQYQNWIKTRNQKRAETEKIAGYDTKHAMHAVRLLNLAYEIATKQTVTIYTKLDKEYNSYLMDIRLGKIPYKDLFQYVENLSSMTEQAFDKSSLPQKADLKKVNALYKIVTDYSDKDRFKLC